MEIYYRHRAFFLFLIAIIIVLSTIIYSIFLGTKGLQIKEYRITDDDIPSSFNGTKIVHFTDTHFGFHYSENQIKLLIEQINQLNPDIVVFTGDLFDDYADGMLDDEYINFVEYQLGMIEARLGKYAIYGNHDYDNKVNSTFKDTLEIAGFTILNNSNSIIYNGNFESIMILGVDDAMHGSPNVDAALSISDRNQNLPEPAYKILLAHEPDYFEISKLSNIDIQLSGHSHKGQISLPFYGAILTPQMARIYKNEYYSVNGKKLYISSGLGTTVLPIRLFNKPSINLYRLSNN